MKWPRRAVLFACVLFLGCAAGGGPSGTGISSTSAISGNIVAVQSGAAAGGTGSAGTLPPIQVSIDMLPSLTTTVDSGGNFALSGDFAGPVTLRFTLPQFQVTQQLDIPAGSAVLLQDIDLEPGAVVAQAARQLNFFGTVDLVDCTGDTLLIHDRRSDGMQYLVHLTDQTTYLDASGTAQSCAAIVAGKTVLIEGSIAYAGDGTTTAAVVTITTMTPPPPRQQLQARFAGALAAIDCSTGFVVIDDSVERTSVQLTPQTQMSGAFACSDLQLGERVRGDGLINLMMPGSLVATHLVVAGPSLTGQPLRVHGFVIDVDCATGVLHLRDDETTTAVQLASSTAISGRGGQRLSCTDINAGDRVEGFGQLGPDAASIDAVQIKVTGAWLGNMMQD